MITNLTSSLTSEEKYHACTVHIEEHEIMCTLIEYYDANSGYKRTTIEWIDDIPEEITSRKQFDIDELNKEIINKFYNNE